MKRYWSVWDVPPLERTLPVAATWLAAARGACVNGDHEAEWRYRNTARLIRRRPPLTDKARCLGRGQ